MRKIFEPIKIGNVEFRNRLVVAGMVTLYCTPDGVATEQYVAYHEAKAKGGWGVIITENHAVTSDGKAFVRVAGLWDDAQIEGHKKLTDRVHQSGGKIVAQIYHAGRLTSSNITGVQCIAPSPLKDRTKNEVPREISIDEIKILVDKFGDCALRVKQAGFDGVEIHGAHGYLINQFLSGFSNKRTDDYGGSIKDRAKFATDIVKNVRSKVGESFPIFFRISSVEYIDGGLCIEESKVIARLLEKAGVDVLHCSQGVAASKSVIIPPHETPVGYYINNAAEIKKVVSIPVIGVGRINDPELAEEILVSGKADFVTMARASLADPELPLKTQEGREEDIMRCIGCLQGCIGENRKGNPIRCLVNPATGMESEYIIRPAEFKKKVFIAGGGITGCEAAIIAARRGHDVTLFDKDAVLGGQWRAAAIPISKTEFNTFIIWQQRQMQKLEVKINLNIELTKDIINTEQPDAVIIATGSKPFKPPIKGIEKANVMLANDVLLGTSKVGEHVIIIGGGMVGTETAVHLAVHGSKVSIIEILSQIVIEGEPLPTELLLKSVTKNNVKVYTSTKVLELTSNSAFLDCDGKEFVIDKIDTVIIAAGARSVNNLEVELEDSGIPIFVAGDALKVKNGYKNIQEGFLAGLNV